MKFILGFIAAVCVSSAMAGSYAWQGGASGTWATSSNWNPNGTPGAGDTASFTSSVEITDGFTVGAGTLTLDVASGAELSLLGAIDGAGAIAKTGSGAISLYGNNTFAGGFTAGETSGATASLTYHGTSFTVNASGGLVGVWHGSGLGAGAATVNATLYVAGDLTVTTPVTKGWGNGPLIIRGSGDVTFNEAFSVRNDLPVNGSGTGNKIYFKKPFEVLSSGVWISTSGGGMSFVFEDDLAGAGSYKCNLAVANGTVDLYGSDNNFATLEIHTNVRFHQANSLMVDSLSFRKSNGWLDLCGCDQNPTNCTVVQADGISNYGVRSDSPAQLKLTNQSKIGYDASNPNFRGVFTGYAGLHFEHNGYSIALDGGEQTTRGTFSVGGTSWIRLINGATCPALGELRLLSSNGGINLANAAAGDIVVNRFYCETIWTKTRFGTDGAGGKIYCRSFSVGSSAKADGTYSKADSAQPVLDAAGGIVVDSGMPNKYVGAAGGDWSSPANWWLGVPAAGSDVFVGGTNLHLTNSTPVLGHVTISNATLTISGWDTALRAADVHLDSNVTVTTPGAFTVDADKSRVLIECGDLTIEDGAAIDVSKKGWSCGLPAGTSGNAAKASGYGPGAGTSCHGAAHGGPGGKNPDTAEGGSLPAVYGSAAEPVDPGSGGYQDVGTTSYANTGTHGGGVVRISATGTVTVHGAILANGGSVLSAGTSSLADRRDTAGSGGSIWITCAKFAGNGGVVEANGGDGSEPCFPQWTWRTRGLAKPAGGGRIAIAYGASQQASDLVDMTISARAGLYTGTSGYFTGSTGNAGTALPLAEQSKFRNNAELGTVWFTDDKLLSATLGTGLSGQVAHPVGYTTAGSVTFSGGWVRFGGEGVSVAIGGDLEVTNDTARLEIGGAAYTASAQAVSMAGISAGRTAVALSVGGNLSVSEGARLDIRSAETNQASTFGASVSVAGDLTIGAHATVAPWSDLFTGGSVNFEVGGNFSVAADGLLSADGLGFAAAASSSDPACGPGRGVNAAAGSYGGKGGIGYNNGSAMNAARAAETYGDRKRPVLAGSGAGCYGYGIGGNGGGVVYVLAHGDMLVDGIVSANGGQGVGADETWNSYYSAWQPSGSGGSVYLYGKTLSGSGVIRANGGDGRQLISEREGFNGLQNTGRGGGGRVAIWTGETDGNELKIREAASISRLAGSFSGSCMATTGAVSFRYDAPEETRSTAPATCSAGEAGTLCFCVVRGPKGSVITFK